MQLRLVIYGILYFSFALGIPSFHYAAAVMIALLVRHRDAPGGLFAPIEGPTMPRRSRPV